MVHALYRAAGLERGVALLALAVFGLEDGSVLPVGWIANRNTVIEALCTASAVLVLVRWRLRPDAGAIAAALALALLACLAKESGVSAPALVALVLAIAARRAPKGSGEARRLRIGAGLGAALAAGGLAFLPLAGYGGHSAFYPTPWGDPLHWLQRLGFLLVAGSAS